MANRASDLETIFSDWTPDQTTAPPTGCALLDDLDTESYTMVQNLRQDILARRNAIFYAPPPHDRWSNSLLAALPMARQLKKQVVIAVRTPEEAKQATASLATILEAEAFSKVFALDLTGLHLYSQVFRIDTPLSKKYCVSAEFCAKLFQSAPKRGIISLDHLKTEAEAQDLPWMPILLNIAAQTPVLVCTFDEIFSFDPHQAQLFKDIVEIGDSIVIFDECQYLHEYITSRFSFSLSSQELTGLTENFTQSKDELAEISEHTRFFTKFIHLFQRFLRENFPLSTPEPQLLDFRVHEFLYYLCDLHKCGLSLLRDTIIGHFRGLQEEMGDDLSANFGDAYLKWFLLFVVAFRLQEDAKMPYSFALHIQNKGYSIQTALLDPRFYSDPLFKNSYATLSMSEAVDVRFYLALTGLGSLQRGFIIRTYPTEIEEPNFRVWGDVSVNPHRARSLELVAAKYASKIVGHVQLTSKPILVCFASSDLMQAILGQELVTRLEAVGKAVIPPEKLAPAAAHELPPDSVIFLNFSEIPPNSLTNYLHQAPIYLFIGIPVSGNSLTASRQFAFLSRKYDPQIAKIAQIHPHFAKVNSICAQLPQNKYRSGILFFLDGSVLEYQKNLLPWAYQLAQYAPKTSEEISKSIAPFSFL